MHAVGSSFHSKASTWKTKLLYLHAPAKHLENTQWCAFSLTPEKYSIIFSFPCQKGSIQSLDWTGGLDWWTGDLQEIYT